MDSPQNIDITLVHHRWLRDQRDPLTHSLLVTEIGKKERLIREDASFSTTANSKFILLNLKMLCNHLAQHMAITEVADEWC